MAIDGRRVVYWDDGALDKRFALRPPTLPDHAEPPTWK
jgi:hypothetical protein